MTGRAGSSVAPPGSPIWPQPEETEWTECQKCPYKKFILVRIQKCKELIFFFNENGFNGVDICSCNLIPFLLAVLIQPFIDPEQQRQDDGEQEEHEEDAVPDVQGEGLQGDGVIADGLAGVGQVDHLRVEHGVGEGQPGVLAVGRECKAHMGLTGHDLKSVSYTHLTLPTIYSV